MKVAVAGGKLQGVEAAYLAHEAGWEVALVDHNPRAPAMGLCDVFHLLDITVDDVALRKAIRSTDLVVPALEDAEALRCLERAAALEGVPIAYDPEAYSVSSSKKKSDSLFAECCVPAPKPGPGPLPLIAKPSCSSGSNGVTKLSTPEEYRAFVERVGNGIGDWVIQEFLEGPSYSLEVLGLHGRFQTLQVTQLEMDGSYDCKRVVAPSDLPPDLVRELERITVEVSRRLDLKGVMDIEVILHEGLLKVLEIDARLPSQTPTAVLKSCGENILRWLYRVFAEGTLPPVEVKPTKAVIYEHVWAHDGILEVTGEHIMGNAGPLRHLHDFFGSDEALTNFRSKDTPWAATLIFVAGTPEDVRDKEHEALKEMMAYCGLSLCLDPAPDDPFRERVVGFDTAHDRNARRHSC
ncbi:MAG TPA: 3-methylornithine--L-lysine ligase PylC [Clostridia bacterium]|nr:3-methylornithine--L-lysine ligase PylC [Clostridia bacterium]